MKENKITVLAIETSCDDTGVAILEVLGTKKSPSFRVLSNVIASQIEIGKKYGGVFPAMAKREHEKNLGPTLETAMKEANVSEKKIDLIAVTNGPGLEPCLWVGVNFAKDLAKKWNVPIIPVNHIEGHILVNFLNPKNRPVDRSTGPAVALVVSGGHTQLILIKGMGKYEILGETRDDAAGECFDKCAKILGLEYPGGPIIAKLADELKAKSYKLKDSLPRPMMHTKDYDFSFSGLKTAVLYSWKKIKLNHNSSDSVENDLAKKQIAMSAEIQQAIIDVLLKKTIKAAKDYNAKTIILGGGVSANQELRKQFQNSASQNNFDLIFPSPDLSTDNAVMIALAGFYNRKAATSDVAAIKADANLRLGK